MSNVIEVDFAMKTQQQLFDRDWFVESRGADIWVSTRTGTFQGWFSDAPDWLCKRLVRMFDALDRRVGQEVSDAIQAAYYDDKSCSEFHVEMSEGLLVFGGYRVTEGMYEVSDDHELIFVNVEVSGDA